MFDDSLMESTGRIRTRAKWLAIGSFLLQATLLCMLILYPLLRPYALPKQALTTLLLAPPPPLSRAELPAHTEVTHKAVPTTLASLTLSKRIPSHVSMQPDEPAAPEDILGLDRASGDSSSNVLKNFFGDGSGPAPHVVEAKPPTTRTGPFRISRGVAEGHLLEPIRPVYPAIARAARIQGTVIIEATISKTGTVINAHAISGPPMLIQAALTAIEQAHYQPYKLSGEPVEVETTIDVQFTLGG
jgi:periplasmic protein TonB